MTQNVKALGKVAVLMGGRSDEREVSLMSGKGVLQALEKQGVDAHAFDPKNNDLKELTRQGFARCFIALHGSYGEDGTVQGALELLDLPYTGSGVMASAIAMDKAMTKRVWIAEGLNTPNYRLLHAHRTSAEELAQVVAQLGLPLIVKPAHGGSSIGVTKVTQGEQLAAAVKAAGGFDGEVLCEQFIDGDEVTCAVLGSGDEVRVLPIVQIVAPEGNYDYEHKYFSDDTQYLCPAPLMLEETERLQTLSRKAYQVLGCRGWGRVDVMVDRRTRMPYLLEINTSPGMTPHSLVPTAARAVGMTYEALCLQVLEQATLDTQARN